MSSVFGSSRYENEVTKGFSIGHSIANVEPKQGKARCLNGMEEDFSMYNKYKRKSVRGKSAGVSLFIWLI